MKTTGNGTAKRGNWETPVFCGNGPENGDSRPLKDKGVNPHSWQRIQQQTGKGWM
ncbi:hypothetical protein J2TS4_42880 [Paenibacillus sp. J2TS4]|nr:hypothetical protein J2TS4_42880 [Paenibacillus sp. J2TS4]